MMLTGKEWLDRHILVIETIRERHGLKESSEILCVVEEKYQKLLKTQGGNND